MDITIRLGEKVVRKDVMGMYQTSDISFEITEKDVPEDKVREKTLALRLQVKKFIVNTKLSEGLISTEQGMAELKPYQDSVNVK
jgi:hypothetical protein